MFFFNCKGEKKKKSNWENFFEIHQTIVYIFHSGEKKDAIVNKYLEKIPKANQKYPVLSCS